MTTPGEAFHLEPVKPRLLQNLFYNLDRSYFIYLLFVCNFKKAYNFSSFFSLKFFSEIGVFENVHNFLATELARFNWLT